MRCNLGFAGLALGANAVQTLSGVEFQCVRTETKRQIEFAK